LLNSHQQSGYDTNCAPKTMIDAAEP